MKKVIAGFVSVIAIIAMCVCMAACSSGITGTYKFSKMSMSYGPMDINIEAGKEYEGEMITADDMVITINEDNTFTITGDLAEDSFGGELEGTWEQTDGKYYLEIEGEKQEITLSGSTLIMESNAEGMSMRIEFKK